MTPANSIDLDFQPGFFFRLADCGFFGALVGFDKAARQRPAPLMRRMLPLDQHDAAVHLDDDADGRHGIDVMDVAAVLADLADAPGFFTLDQFMPADRAVRQFVEPSNSRLHLCDHFSAKRGGLWNNGLALTDFISDQREEKTMNETIRWGIIGVGDVTEVKSGPGFQKAEHSALVAVMRRDAAKARDYAERHGVAALVRRRRSADRRC